MKFFLPILSLLLFSIITHAQIITTVAGCTDTNGYSGDGGLAINARLFHPDDVKFDENGNMLIADSYNNVIRKVDKLGVITTIMGTGLSGYTGDGGPATLAKSGRPGGLAIDSSGNIFFSDCDYATIRKISSDGKIETIAGTPLKYGDSGDGGLAKFAKLYAPYGIIVDKKGNIIFTDAYNNKIKKIDKVGIINTIAGTGVAGYNGDSIPASAAELNAPGYLALDTFGNIYVADWKNHRVRKIDTFGIITTVAGRGTQGNSGDGGLATNAEFWAPNGVAVDNIGNIYINDDYNHNVRKVNTAGTISTVAGTGTAGFNGDGIIATTAKLNNPNSVTVDTNGNLYIADTYNNRIRKITFNVGVPNIEASHANISIYPNPASSQLEITASTKIESVVITNTLGQIVYNTPSPKGANTIHIDLSNFAAGLYFVKINGVYIQKIIKE